MLASSAFIMYLQFLFEPSSYLSHFRRRGGSGIVCVLHWVKWQIPFSEVNQMDFDKKVSFKFLVIFLFQMHLFNYFNLNSAVVVLVFKLLKSVVRGSEYYCGHNKIIYWPDLEVIVLPWLMRFKRLECWLCDQFYNKLDHNAPLNPQVCIVSIVVARLLKYGVLNPSVVKICLILYNCKTMF